MGMVMKARIRSVLWPALFLVTLLFIYIPVQILFYNQPQFPRGLVKTLMTLTPFAVAGLTVLFMIARVLPSRSLEGYSALLFSLAVTGWAQAFLLAPPSGQLDGQSFNVSFGAQELWLNSTLSVLTLAVCLILYVRFSQLCRSFSILVTAGFMAFCGYAVIMAAPGMRFAEKGTFEVFSREQNVLVLLFDAFQSDSLHTIIARRPELQRDLDGFVFFDHAVGVASTTYLTMPAIHSGLQYEHGGSIRSLYKRGVVEGSFLRHLVDKGYNADIINPLYKHVPLGAAADSLFRWCYGEATETIVGAMRLLGMSLFRSVPLGMRAYIYDEGYFLTEPTLVRDYNKTSDLLLQRLTDRIKVVDRGRYAKFAHLFNTHAPAALDASCDRRKGQPWTVDTATAQAECAVNRLVALVNRLKAVGVYNNTLIVVLADTGAGVPTRGKTLLEALASPLLLVKPYDGVGALQVSNRLVGIKDVAATICTQTRACVVGEGRSVFAEDVRDSVYLFSSYRWKHEMWRLDQIPVETWKISQVGRGDVTFARVIDGPLPKVRVVEFQEGEPFYGNGWSVPESAGKDTWMWTDTRRASLYLDLSPKRDYSLRFTVRTHGGNPNQRVSVKCNGIRVGQFDISATQAMVEKVVNISAGAIRDGPDEIGFEFSQANTPGKGDPRTLAVAFYRLVID
jgi:hypothetical protein